MRIQRVILIFLLALLFCNSGYAQTTEEEMLTQAKQHFQNQKYSYATTWLDRLLKSYPRSSHKKEALLLSAQAYAASDREEKAADTLRTLKKEFPDALTGLDPKLLELLQKHPEPKPAPPAAPAAPAPAQPAAAPAQKSDAAPSKPSSATAALPAAQSGAVPAATVPAATVPAAAAPAPAPAGKTAALPAVSVYDPNLFKDDPDIDAPPWKAAKAAAAKVPEEATQPKGAVPVVAQPAAPVERQLATTKAAPAATPAATPAVAPASPGKAPSANGYTLQIGQFVLASEMSEAKQIILKAGLSPVVAQGPKKTVPMIRLQVESGTDKESATRKLAELRKAAGVGMILVGNGKYRVYAGSYYSEAAAENERQRLSAAGLTCRPQRIMLPVPTFLLTAGTFGTREAALAAGAKLETAGLFNTIVEADR